MNLLDQLWKLMGSGRLINKNGPWEHEDKLWSFKQDYLFERNSANVLSPTSNDSRPENEVALEKKQVTISKAQKWSKGIKDQDGYFPLQNLQNGKYLAAESNETTLIIGNYVLLYKVVLTTTFTLLSSQFKKRRGQVVSSFIKL